MSLVSRFLELDPCEAKDFIVQQKISLNKDGFAGSFVKQICLKGDFEHIRLVFLNGGCCDSSDVHGQTPIHFLCQYNKLAEIKFLVRSGIAKLCAFFRADNSGMTPYSLACENGNKSLIQYLDAELRLDDIVTVPLQNDGPIKKIHSLPQFSAGRCACCPSLYEFSIRKRARSDFVLASRLPHSDRVPPSLFRCFKDEARSFIEFGMFSATHSCEMLGPSKIDAISDELTPCLTRRPLTSNHHKSLACCEEGDSCPHSSWSIEKFGTVSLDDSTEEDLYQGIGRL